MAAVFCEFSFFVQPQFFAIPSALEQKCAILMALFLIQKSAWEMPQQTTLLSVLLLLPQDFLVPLLHGLCLFLCSKTKTISFHCKHRKLLKVRIIIPAGY